MNIKHKLSILAASLLLAACTSENEVVNPAPPDNGGSNKEGREVLLTLKNKLNLQSTGTKAGDAIATANENYINALDVYVFGSLTEDGPYTFQELFYYREDPSEKIAKDWAHTFTINASADGKTSTGLLRLTKGLFVKVYCVANQKELYNTDAGGATALFTDFRPLIQTAPGQANNTVTVGVPTETDFMKLHSNVLNPTVEDDVIVTPLPMTGAYTVPLNLTDFSVSTRTQIGFKLSRMVARFDIVNNAEESKFTVTSVSMAKGRKGAYLFPVKPLGGSPAAAADLITYPVRPLDENTQVAGQATSFGAFYSWPSPKEDQGYLILKGKYRVNKTEMKEVTYQVPFEQVTNGSGSYIEVAGNHRYTIAITKADEYHLDFNLSVNDWSDEGNMDEYQPENDFDKTSVTLDAGATAGANVLSDGSIMVDPAVGSKFGFTIAANSIVTDVLSFEGDVWIEKISTKASMQNVFQYKVVDGVAGLTDIAPCVIRLTNAASGKSKEIRVIPPAGPTVRLASNYTGFSKYDAATNTVNVYNIAGQTTKLTVTSPKFVDGTTGSSVDNTSCTWMTPDNASSNEETADYILTLPAAQANLSTTGTLVFKSTANQKATTVKVALQDATMTLGSFNNQGNAANMYNATGSTSGGPKVTLEGSASNMFTIQISAPEGLVPSVTLGDDWLETSTRLDADGKTVVLTGQVKTGVSDFTSAKSGKILLTNKITGGSNLEIEVATTIVAAP